MLARLESSPMGFVEKGDDDNIGGTGEMRRNHRIEFSVDAIPGQFTRYPEEGEYIKGLVPRTLVEHRLCCHINNHLFICDYGQGASHNMALECVVEYTKKGDAFLKIYIQSPEMSGARCSFNWSSLDQKTKEHAEEKEETGNGVAAIAE